MPMTLVCVCAMAATSLPVARFALVVGENRPNAPGEKALRYADDDAVATHRLLETAGVHSVLLTTLDQDTLALNPTLPALPAAKREEIKRAMDGLSAAIAVARQQGQRTHFFFFYSGHGNVEQGEGYVVLEDGHLTRSNLFKDILGRTGADHNHVMVDSCKSYYFAFGRGGQRAPADLGFSKLGDAAVERNTGFLLSTSSDKDSHEWEQFQGGIFSHEVRSALWGGADANGDGSVTYAELGAFLTVANAGITNARYRPDFLVRAPSGEAPVFLDWSGGLDTLTLGTRDAGAAAWGHVYVEDAQGLRLWDVNPQPQQSLTLHLPPQRPVFVRSAGDEQESILKDSGPLVLSQLLPAQSGTGKRGALHLAFGKLFSQPFGAEAVALYQKVTVTAAQKAAPKTVLPKFLALRLALGGGLGVAALGAAVGLGAGVLAQGAALERYATGLHTSQAQRHERNQVITALNVSGWIFGALFVAGAAAAVLLLGALVGVEIWLH